MDFNEKKQKNPKKSRGRAAKGHPGRGGARPSASRANRAGQDGHSPGFSRTATPHRVNRLSEPGPLIYSRGGGAQVSLSE